MSLKASRGVTLDKEVDQIFKNDPTINASALINDLLRKHFGLKEEEKNE